MPTPGPGAQPAAVPAPPDLLSALAHAQSAFATLLADADPDAPVAACAPWTVTDLALHLGGVHRWAAGMVRGTDDGGEDPTGPREHAALLRFYREQADILLATLGAVDPAAPALTLAGPGTVAFWHRRQLHETLVHVHDLAGTTGTPHPVHDPAVWADTVDEVVTVMAPRQVRLGRTAPPPEGVRLVAVDARRSWVLDAGAAPTGGPGTPTTTVRAPARTLALLLWGRTTAADPLLAVEGDAGVLAAALAGRLTP